MSRDYETLYYEQQASFTESNGMLTRENEELRKRISEVQSELADWETATGCKTHPDAALRFELLQQRIEALTEELWDAKELSRQRMEYAENVAKAADEFLAAWENDLGIEVEQQRAEALAKALAKDSEARGAANAISGPTHVTDHLADAMRRDENNRLK